MVSAYLVRQVFAVLLAGARNGPALPAHQGVRTFNTPPVKLLQQKCSLTPTLPSLHHFQLTSVQLNADGGNSGSPVNPNGEIVGLLFDGNIGSLRDQFAYDSYQNRAVAVPTGGMTEAMEKLYGAPKRMDELLGP